MRLPLGVLAERKVTRMLRAGRVRVLQADACDCMVSVVGDHDDWLVVVEDGEASCNCPGFAWRGDCSHRRCAELVCGACREPLLVAVPLERFRADVTAWLQGAR